MTIMDQVKVDQQLDDISKALARVHTEARRAYTFGNTFAYEAMSAALAAERMFAELRETLAQRTSTTSGNGKGDQTQP